MSALHTAIKDENVRLTRQVRKLKKERGKAIKGLEHYADPRNYTDEGVVTDGAAFGWNHPDRGAYARSILEEINK